MGTQILSSLVIILFISCVAQSAKFTVKNNCPYTIWPATLSGKGNVALTGFELPPQASNTFDVPSPWSGRVWARFQCSTSAGKFTCRSGDCNSGQIRCGGNTGGVPPTSLAEFTLAGAGGNDFFDVSLVDGFNLPLSIRPDRAGCRAAACPVDINSGCPSELALRDARGGVIGCKSACLAFNQPQYCCTGAYGGPNTCKPTRYSQAFKAKCPQAYSYAYDDKTSTFTCPTGGNYLITFCP